VGASMSYGHFLPFLIGNEVFIMVVYDNLREEKVIESPKQNVVDLVFVPFLDII
jgi:hypothetical protein